MTDQQLGEHLSHGAVRWSCCESQANLELAAA
jgi:hypothetical protein